VADRLGLEDLNNWLIKIAENTAVLRDHAKKGAGPMGKGADDSERVAGRFERAMEAFGKRFESALARWQRTPVEKIVDRGFDTAMRQLDRAATTLMSTGRGLVNRGMSGTLEGARYDYAMEQLSRQMAAVFSPITNAMTYFATRVETMMRGMSGGAQNRLMGAGIGGVAGYMMGGPLGGLAGMTLGGMMMGGPHDNDSMRGTMAGAYLGFRAGGLPGAFVGALAGNAAGSPVHLAGEGPSGYYNRMRSRGESVLGAGWETAGRGVSMMTGDLLRGMGADTNIGMAYGGTLAMGARDKHRDVTPYQAEMGEAGSAYFRMQAATIRATATAGFEDAGPLKPIVDGMVEIIKLLGKLAGVEMVEPPPSVEGARRT